MQSSTIRHASVSPVKIDKSIEKLSDTVFNNRSESLGMTKFNPVLKNNKKSLNMGVRKRELDRIERENHAFAKRLFSNPGSIQKREMDA